MKKYRNIIFMIVTLLALAVVAYVVLADPTISASDCHMYINAYPHPIYNPYPANCLYFPNVGMGGY